MGPGVSCVDLTSIGGRNYESFTFPFFYFLTVAQIWLLAEALSLPRGPLDGMSPKAGGCGW